LTTFPLRSGTADPGAMAERQRAGHSTAGPLTQASRMAQPMRR
jgi:hypothetical protein